METDMSTDDGMTNSPETETEAQKAKEEQEKEAQKAKLKEEKAIKKIKARHTYLVDNNWGVGNSGWVIYLSHYVKPDGLFAPTAAASALDTDEGPHLPGSSRAGCSLRQRWSPGSLA